MNLTLELSSGAKALIISDGVLSRTVQQHSEPVGEYRRLLAREILIEKPGITSRVGGCPRGGAKPIRSPRQILEIDAMQEQPAPVSPVGVAL